ncbi:MAG: DUF4921 family protein [Fuerstiella sp.]|nr:DUF4921 family protein [Fuerstiella sp.]
MVLHHTNSVLRIDILTGRHVIVAPSRSQRPGAATSDPVLAHPKDGNPYEQGRESRTPDERLALRRIDSRPNTAGWLVRVVPNQFPALVSCCETSTEPHDRYLKSLPAFGTHEVVIESPVAHRRLSALSVAETARILLAWQLRLRDLEQQPDIKSITVFRNEGFSAGASLSHVHSQILATNIIPPQTATRLQRSSHHRKHYGKCLLHDLCETEVADGTRIVSTDPMCIVMCPYAGRVSWQMRIVPRQSAFDSFSNCTNSQLINIAGHLHAAATAIDQCAGQMAMNIVLVQPPIANSTNGWFLDLMPRSTRMAGYELATDVDIVTVAPESAAVQLRRRYQLSVPPPDDVVPPEYEWRGEHC